ncbi:MAG: hypothetical protein AAGA99_20695 [Actinomycetota bacterium]
MPTTTALRAPLPTGPGWRNDLPVVPGVLLDPSPPPPIRVGDGVPDPRRFAVAAALVALAAGLLAGVFLGSSSAYDVGRRADITEQGLPHVAAPNGSTLLRRADSLAVTFELPTPNPGTYAYPRADGDHPLVVQGEDEVFTLWALVFNEPERCLGACDVGDLGDSPARGGLHRVDGTIAHGGSIALGGEIWSTRPPAAGVALTDPLTAEVQLVLVPHGGARTGTDLERQLTTPIGDPSHWWTATFG